MSAVVLKLDLASAEHQLTRILPEQITSCWPFIVTFIEEALTDGPDEPDLMLIFNNLISGIMEAWVLVRKGDEEDWSDAQTAAVITLQVNEDISTGNGRLFLYSLSGTEYLTDDIWADMLVAAAEYARQRGCSSVSAVSTNERVIQVFKEAGGNVDARYLSMKVGE